jgi:hypothetical protein
MVMARDAVALGMADRVGTLDETIQRYLAGARPPRRRGAGAEAAAAQELDLLEREAAALPRRA